MEDANTVVVGGEVEGNITKCDLIDKTVNIEKSGAFALTQERTVVVMNTCTSEIIDEYSVSQINGSIIGAVVSVIVILFLVAVIMEMS